MRATTKSKTKSACPTPRPACRPADYLTADTGLAHRRFGDAVRTTAFSLNLSAAEIRMMTTQLYDEAFLAAGDQAAVQRLVDKGLLVRDLIVPSRLSRAGRLVRKLLVLSRHIPE